MNDLLKKINLIYKKNKKIESEYEELKKLILENNFNFFDLISEQEFKKYLVTYISEKYSKREKNGLEINLENSNGRMSVYSMNLNEFTRFLAASLSGIEGNYYLAHVFYGYFKDNYQEYYFNEKTYINFCDGHLYFDKISDLVKTFNLDISKLSFSDAMEKINTYKNIKSILEESDLQNIIDLCIFK